MHNESSEAHTSTHRWARVGELCGGAGDAWRCVTGCLAGDDGGRAVSLRTRGNEACAGQA